MIAGAAGANFSWFISKAAWESTGGAAGELKFEDCAPHLSKGYPTYPRRGTPQNTAAYPFTFCFFLLVAEQLSYQQGKTELKSK